MGVSTVRRLICKEWPVVVSNKVTFLDSLTYSMGGAKLPSVLGSKLGLSKSVWPSCI